ncbi:MAG: hypothetical protein IID44_23565 [Planctomycetes bacterium]|nr:hypothetical protein [Planctomycetota bacterium]
MGAAVFRAGPPAAWSAADPHRFEVTRRPPGPSRRGRSPRHCPTPICTAWQHDQFEAAWSAADLHRRRRWSIVDRRRPCYNLSQSTIAPVPAEATFGVRFRRTYFGRRRSTIEPRWPSHFGRPSSHAGHHDHFEAARVCYQSAPQRGHPPAAWFVTMRSIAAPLLAAELSHAAPAGDVTHRRPGLGGGS